MKNAVCRRSGKCAWAAPLFTWTESHAARPGDFAPCGARPGTLSLDSAAFEKAGETFILREGGVRCD